MRRFEDADGLAWDVVAGRESWGNLYALFVPAGPDRTDPVRQTLLAAESYEQAEQELSDLDEAGLRELLARSTEKPH